MKNNLKFIAFIAISGLLMIGCPEPSGQGSDTFTAVTSITGIPTGKQTGVDLTLNGTVVPSSATNKTIVWSIAADDDGSTGPSLDGNVLSTESDGTVKVTATIANGASASTPYTQTFTINVTDDYVEQGGTRYVAVTVNEMTVGSEFDRAYIAVYADSALTQFIDGGRIYDGEWAGVLSDTPTNNTVYAAIIVRGSDQGPYAAKVIETNLGNKEGTETAGNPKSVPISFGNVATKSVTVHGSILINGASPNTGGIFWSSIGFYFEAPGLLDENGELLSFDIDGVSASGSTMTVADVDYPFPIRYSAFGYDSKQDGVNGQAQPVLKLFADKTPTIDGDTWTATVNEIAKKITGTINASDFGVSGNASVYVFDAVTNEGLLWEGDPIYIGSGYNRFGTDGFKTLIPSADVSRSVYIGIGNAFSLPFTVNAGTAEQNIGPITVDPDRRPPKVTFNANGGNWEGSTAAKEQLVNMSNQIGTDMPDNPTRAVHVFVNWNTAEDGSGTPFTGSTTVLSDTTVYAQWNFVPAKITFKVNSGMWRDGTTTDIELQTDRQGVINPLPVSPIRNGNKFDGWNTNSGGSGNTVTNSMVFETDTDVYAKWTTDATVVVATITFNANGGNWSGENTVTRYALGGETITPPNAPTTAKPFESDTVQVPTGKWLSENLTEGLYMGAASLCEFDGWNTQADGNGTAFTSSTVVTATTTIYAKWKEPANPTWVAVRYDLSGVDTTWGSEFIRLATIFVRDNPGDYILMIGSNESINDTRSISNVSSVMLVGAGGSRIITKTGNGSLFLVNNANAKLTLDYNITLQGHSSNTSALVIVDNGNLVMNEGAIITGNNSTSSYGGGVVVYAGSFTMNGGTISNNTAMNGGGVSSDGTFIMNGGTISGNNAISGTGGGGVSITSGTFTMNDGAIITGNTATGSGGGVYGGSYGYITINGGTISGNTAGNGGGVYGGNITMTGGIISGNTATSLGGGIYAGTGGAIVLNKTGGIIYGSEAAEGLRNTATQTNGQAVYDRNYNAGSPIIKFRNTTAGDTISLHTMTDPNWGE